MTAPPETAAPKDTLPPFRCPVCDSLLNDPVLVWETSARGTVGIRRCPKCGLHITWPRLDDPQSPYHADDREAWEAKYGAIVRGERLHDRHQNYLEEVSTLERYIPSGRILDVGCNAGWLLGYLQKSKHPYELEGLEPSPSLAEIARRRLGITIHTAYLETLAGRDAYYAGVVATDVIEHVMPEDIHSFLDAIARVLQPGGYVFLKTPNARFTALKSRVSRRLPKFIRRLIMRHDDVWDAKEHVIHWDVDNLKRLLEQRDLMPVQAFAPLPVQTYNSRIWAYIARSALYSTARLLGGRRRVPGFAQDIFVIARKAP